jgi:hypothetical protein
VITNPVNQSPASAISVLLFHDAVELFLAMAVDAKNIRVRSDISFLEYWDKLKDLRMKKAMTRLNKARVAFKHHGNLPSSTDIEEYRVHTRDFFRENTVKYFAVSFEAISLVELVKPEQARPHLRKAQERLSDDDPKQAIVEVTKAFLIVTNRGTISPFPPAGSSNPFSHGEQELRSFADAITEKVARLQDQVTMLSLGLDYRDFLRFRSIVPSVARSQSGKFQVRTTPGLEPSEEEVAFALEYVVETAIRMSETDRLTRSAGET